MPRANLNKEKIFQAAAELANRDGFAALNLKDVAAHFDVKPPSLFKHVRDFSEIRDAIALSGLTKLHLALLEIEANNISDRIRKICHAYRNLARMYPGEYDAFQETHVKRPPEVYVIAEKILTILRSTFSDYNDGANTIHLLRLMRSAIHGFVIIEKSNGFGLKEDVDESFNFLVEALVGLVANADSIQLG